MNRSSRKSAHRRTAAAVVVASLAAFGVVAARQAHANAASVASGRPDNYRMSLDSSASAPTAVTTFLDPTGRLQNPRDVTAGPDGNLWFTAGRDQLGRITTEGVVTMFEGARGQLELGVRGNADARCVGVYLYHSATPPCREHVPLCCFEWL